MNPVNVDRPNDLQVYFIDDSIREAERRRDLISETLTLDNLLPIYYEHIIDTFILSSVARSTWHIILPTTTH